MSLFRAQVVTEEKHLTSEGRRLQAMAKCMAAPVVEIRPPSLAAIPEEPIDADGQVVPESRRRGRAKKFQRFLLPVPLQATPPQQDEQMKGDDAQPSIRCETCRLQVLGTFPMLCDTDGICSGARLCILVAELATHTPMSLGVLASPCLCMYRIIKRCKRDKTPGPSGKVKKRAVVGKYSGGCLQKRVPKFSCTRSASRKKS